MSRRVLLSVAFLLVHAFALARVDAQPLPAASGRVIEAADGDVVLVPQTAKVSVVTRTQVQARLVYVAAQQTLLLLTDPALGGAFDLHEAKGFRRWQVQGTWPLEPRWEGSATIDEYMPFNRSPLMMAIHTDRGTILVAPATGMDIPNPPPAIALLRTTSSSGRAVRGSFDEIEQAWLTNGDNGLAGPGPTAFAQLRMRSSAAAAAAATPGSSAAPVPQPLRVGGNIRAPRRTLSADPVYPSAARDAGIQGVVILEVTVGEDGAVADARVLRSIPMLDAAAVEAVKQWRYEPTLLNGVPVRLIMTVTVNFTLPPSR